MMKCLVLRRESFVVGDRGISGGGMGERTLLDDRNVLLGGNHLRKECQYDQKETK